MIDQLMEARRPSPVLPPTARVDAVRPTIPPPPTQNALGCQKCGGDRVWQSAGDDRWKCKTCEPPGQVSDVARYAVGGRITEVEAEEKPTTLEAEGRPGAIAKPPTLPPGSDGAHLVSETILTGCTVACMACLSQWYVEKTWSDGSRDLNCYCCRRAVTGELFPLAAEEIRERKRQARRDEDESLKD